MISKVLVWMIQGTVQYVPNIIIFVYDERHEKLSSYGLSYRFGIGPKCANSTPKVTAQCGICLAILKMSRRYRSDIFYEVKWLHGKFSTNILWSKVISLEVPIITQVYSHKCGFYEPYHHDK